MMVSYKKLWHLLIERDMNKTELQKASKISTSTFAKLSKGEPVNMNILLKICDVLKCNITDIVDYEPPK